MGRVSVSAAIDLPPERAMTLWTDLRRWPAFVEGFRTVLSGAREWPAPGARLIWQSAPGGRGRVTERVVDVAPGERIVTDVFEERLTGTQRVSFGPPAHDGPGAATVEIALEYRLAREAPLAGVFDFLFVRRAQRDALARTLRRFAVEAAEEADL